MTEVSVQHVKVQHLRDRRTVQQQETQDYVIGIVEALIDFQKDSKRGLYMAHEYVRFECRVCGDQVFVLLGEKNLSDSLPEVEHFELTCSQGHTDSYDSSSVGVLMSKLATKLQFRRAAAGIG